MSAGSVMILDELHAGDRWTYGLRNRPAMIGTVPIGRIVGADRPDPHGTFGHGLIDYARPLNDKEIAAYELTPLRNELSVYRVRCAVNGGNLDPSSEAWRAFWGALGVPIFEERDLRDRIVEREQCVLQGTDLVCPLCGKVYGESHDPSCSRAMSGIDEGIDFEAQIGIGHWDRSWRAINAARGLDRWIDSRLVIDAYYHRQFPWRKFTESQPDAYTNREFPKNLAEFRRFFREGDPIHLVDHLVAPSNVGRTFYVREVNTVGVALVTDKDHGFSDKAWHLTFRKAANYRFAEDGWSFLEGGTIVCRYKYGRAPG